MGKIIELPGKILYGLLFVAVLPFILILWAKYTKEIVTLPLPASLIPGYILIVVGVIFIFAGIWNLWRSGKGLPMNAYPPKKFVKNGIYAFTGHPVYLGAALISFGLSAVTRSSSGFWLVSPVFTLLIVAYVAGFENEKTESLFGRQNYKPFLSLPEDSGASPSHSERLASYFLAFLPWLIVYEAFIFIGVQKDAIVTNLPFEKNLPVWEFSEIFYSLTYLFVIAVPLVIKTRKQLRSFITDIWFAVIIVGIFYLVFPMMVKQKEFIPDSFFGRLIMFERSMDGEACALPSFHVIWAFMAATYFSRSFMRLRWIWFLLAILISVSCITTSSHSIPDVLAGFLMFIIVIYRQQIWNFIRIKAEWLSNSWREWRIGPVRIINHGIYGGIAGFVGTLLAGFFLGRENALVSLLVMSCVLIGSGLWAQIIEGSSKLLRPFGYYGGIIGGTLACVAAHFIFSINFFVMFAAFAMAAPWIQILGRLRCLVQGCCHGKPSNENIGIRFTHPNSRVNKISGLAGVPLHPTQLYSIGTNILIGLVLIRLFRIGVPSSFIVGIYFILNGTGRFVEESFRGEAQTPYWAGMRIYQWIAIISILTGIICTAIPGTGVLLFQPNLLSLFLATGMGIIIMIASGVDFPESSRRFARLTSN